MRIKITNRSGFTLIEVMVAAALSMGLMVVLAGGFQAGLESFRILKATGDQNERLRSVANLLRSDLSFPHFGGTFTSQQGPNLKDQWLDDPTWRPPLQGFFRIIQGSQVVETANTFAPYRFDGRDPDNIRSYIATDHALHFTVNVLDKTTGNPARQRYGDLFMTRLQGPSPPIVKSLLNLSHPEAFIDPLDGTPTGGGNFVSPWAEVAYYLTDTGEVIKEEGVPPTATSVKLYALRRRQRLAVMTPPPVPPFAPPGYQVPSSMPYQEISHVSTNLVVNSPSDLTQPDRRWLGIWAGSASSPYQNPTEQLGAPSKNQQHRLGDDIVLTNVISFEVKPTWQWSRETTINSVHQTQPDSSKLDWPFDDLPSGDNSFYTGAGIRIFDTWTDRDDPMFASSLYAANWNPNLGAAGNRNYRIPLKIRVTALQIRLRIWDTKRQQARQVTIVQDV